MKKNFCTGPFIKGPNSQNTSKNREKNIFLQIIVKITSAFKRRNRYDNGPKNIRIIMKV